MSLLDNDLYKFSMQQAAWTNYPDTRVEYTFNNRSSSTHAYTQAAFELLSLRIQQLDKLYLSQLEREWLVGSCPYFTPAYIAYLSDFRFNTSEDITTEFDAHSKILFLRIHGLWHQVILYEVVILSLVSECYFQIVDQNWSNTDQQSRAIFKSTNLILSGVHFSDFGTRRRRNYETQDMVISTFQRTFEELKDHSNSSLGAFMGTSNLHFAMKYNLPALGTVAHEWTMALTVLEKSIVHANRNALLKWLEIYSPYFKIALTDTYGTDIFFADFNSELANAYDGVRHDSGDPFKFTDKIISHYDILSIKLSSKSIIFSDSLNTQKCIDILQYVSKRNGPKCIFGIGTHLTNDFPESPAMNIVIKLSMVNGEHVIKLSDDPGKHQGNPVQIKQVIETLALRDE